MKKLYYINNNMALCVIDLPTFNVCIDIPEDLLFVAFRDGLNFIKEPPDLYPFTDIERIIMSTEAFDLSFVKESDFRKQNTKFCPNVIETPPLVIDVFSTEKKDGIEKIWLHIPYTANVTIMILDKMLDCGVVTGIPLEYGTNGFDNLAYNNTHSFDITSIGGDVFNLSNVQIGLFANNIPVLFQPRNGDNFSFFPKVQEENNT